MDIFYQYYSFFLYNSINDNKKKVRRNEKEERKKEKQ